MTLGAQGLEIGTYMPLGMGGKGFVLGGRF